MVVYSVTTSADTARQSCQHSRLHKLVQNLRWPNLRIVYTTLMLSAHLNCLISVLHCFSCFIPLPDELLPFLVQLSEVLSCPVKLDLCSLCICDLCFQCFFLHCYLLCELLNCQTELLQLAFILAPADARRKGCKTSPYSATAWQTMSLYQYTARVQQLFRPKGP